MTKYSKEMQKKQQNSLSKAIGQTQQRLNLQSHQIMRENGSTLTKKQVERFFQKWV